MGKPSSSEDEQPQAAQAALAQQMAATGKTETQEGIPRFNLALPSLEQPVANYGRQPAKTPPATATTSWNAMNFGEGMRRLAIFVGVLGMIAGGSIRI